ncbi:MAG: helix-hairpin-helix domain-containing protein [Candidatus Limnocylindrales bacterium]
MDAPWRALEGTDGSPGEPTPSRWRPSANHLILALALFVAIGALAVVVVVGLTPGGQVDLVSVPGESPASRSQASQTMVVVQVAGAVLRPGVYSLPAGSRVADAIQAAGGYSTDVDPRAAETKLNLAAKLQDAQSIVVPRRGDVASGSPGTHSSLEPGAPINLNTATAEQLDSLPGIGPATAAKIISSREQLPFASVDDLVSRKLVSASTLAKFRDLVTV